MKRRRRWALGLAVVVALALAGGVVTLYLVNHDADNDDAPATKPKPAAAALGPAGTPVITLDPAAQAQNDIAVLTLKPAPQPMMIAAFGAVVDPAALSDLSQRAALARAAREEAAARARAAAATYRRDQGLFRDQRNVSAAALEEAEANDRAAAAALAAREADIRGVEEAARSQWGAVLGADLIAGGGFAASVARGEACLVSIGVPPETGMALAEKPPALAIATVAPGAPVGIALRLISALPRVDPRAKTPLLLYTAPCARGLLPGMTLPVTLESGVRPAALRVPAEAVLWWQGRAWVYRQIAPGRFARAAIATDQPSPEGGFIIDAPTPDAAPMMIVGRGAAALFSEEFRGQIQLGEGDSDP